MTFFKYKPLFSSEIPELDPVDKTGFYFEVKEVDKTPMEVASPDSFIKCCKGPCKKVYCTNGCKRCWICENEDCTKIGCDAESCNCKNLIASNKSPTPWKYQGT